MLAKIRGKISGMERAYEEVIDFIASGTTPGNLIAFRPSEASKERVAELIRRKKTSGLSENESSELEHYLQLEHLMRLAKARAQHHLTT
jgi:O-succinylbenzoate synthase